MKKSSLDKMLKELKTYLTSESALEAIKTLKQELKNYTEPPKKELSPDDFEVPKELTGKDLALALFSDGACRGNPGPGSYAFIVQNSRGEVLASEAQVSEQTTNNKMELSGVIKGLEYLSSQTTPMHQIFIYTDSKYVVDGMNSWVVGWKKRGWKKADNKVPENVELWQKLDELNSQMNCTYLWVKGHAGHPQNEYVDELANIALDQNGF